MRRSARRSRHRQSIRQSCRLLPSMSRVGDGVRISQYRYASETIIIGYGTSAARVLRRSRRGGQLHPRGRAHSRAQPAVSAQIQRLEREVGQPAGPIASHGAVDGRAKPRCRTPRRRSPPSPTCRSRSRSHPLVRGVVRLGTVTSHSVDVPSLLADFHAEHPNVEITLSTDSSDALIEKVRTGGLDAAIVSVGPTSDRRALTWRS